MFKMSKIRQITAGLMAAAVVCAAAMIPAPVLAVSQSDINELKNNADDLSAQKKALEKKLSALSSDKAVVMQKKHLLDDQIAVQVKEISNVENQIATYKTLIVQTEKELADAQARAKAQYELFCRRVRAMEEEGTISYWSVLFKSGSFTDLLGRLDAVNEIMDADQAVIDELEQLQKEISEKQATLESSKADAESAKSELESKKVALESQRKEANKLIQDLAANENETEAAIDGMEEEEEAIQKKIVEMSKKLAEQQAAAKGGTTSNAALGGYIWPVSSHRITSTFGGRASPGGIGSTNHKGVDIGRVGYTTEVHAAKAGTVIVAQRSSSYGNYVVISHGSGNTTLYGHMSSLSVSAGQSVSQGTTIGITGSTGNSTGPHLHFEITEKSVRINPLKYLTGYNLAK